MAELNDNLIYLITTFFCLVIAGFIFMIVVNGTVYPQLVNALNMGVNVDAASKADVMSGYSLVLSSIKILIPALFLGALIAVILFIFFRREEEDTGP